MFSYLVLFFLFGVFVSCLIWGIVRLRFPRRTSNKKAHVIFCSSANFKKIPKSEPKIEWLPQRKSLWFTISYYFILFLRYELTKTQVIVHRNHSLPFVLKEKKQTHTNTIHYRKQKANSSTSPLPTHTYLYVAFCNTKKTRQNNLWTSLNNILWIYWLIEDNSTCTDMFCYLTTWYFTNNPFYLCQQRA